MKYLILFISILSASSATSVLPRIMISAPAAIQKDHEFVMFCLKQYMQIAKQIEAFAAINPQQYEVARKTGEDLYKDVLRGCKPDTALQLNNEFLSTSPSMIFHDNFQSFLVGQHLKLLRKILDYVVDHKEISSHTDERLHFLHDEFLPMNIFSAQDLGEDEKNLLPSRLQTVMDQWASEMTDITNGQHNISDLHYLKQLAKLCQNAAEKFLAPCPFID